MKTIFEKSNGTDGINLTDEMVNIDFLPENLLREDKAGLPQLSELDVMRHYKRII